MLKIQTTLCSAAALAAILASAPAIAWEPTKPVEIVVAAGAGGASDQMARMMQAAIQKNNLMKQPMVVSLKGGASGGEALLYMKGSDGDPHKVLIAYSLIYMLPLSAKIPFNWRELTPVSVIALDQFILWDNSTMPPRTSRNLSPRRRPPSSRSRWVARGSKREDHVLTVFLEKKTGAKFAYLPYNRAAKRQRSSSAITPRPTSTIRRKILKSGAPARCVRSACSTRSEFRTRPRSRTPNPERRADLQGRRARHPASDAARHVPARQQAPDQTAFYIDLFKGVSQTVEYKDYMEKQALADLPHWS
jgi:hypothetical protein